MVPSQLFGQMIEASILWSVFNTNKKLVIAFALSWLNYSLYTDLPNCSLVKLQRTQINAAHIVFQTQKTDHTTPLLYKFCWLPD